MYMSLNDLRNKFATDQAFAIQFVKDAAAVGIAVDILDSTGAQVDAIFDDSKKLIGGKLYDDLNLLNTYVRVVKKITETNDTPGKARLYDYIHAPFNEPDFTIDTNTRVITVPPEFTKNGVGVMGDHLAEILFFTMPRFFDVVDLLESTNINIYWYNSGVRELQYHKATPVVKYAVGDTLYLGWAISELASVAAGNVEFFFEFEHTNADGLVDFRLETQPAKVSIKPTLSLDKNATEADSYNDIVYSRAIYSPIINSLTAAPARITTNLTEGHLDFDPDTNNITLHIDAVSPDDGDLLFNWNWNGVMVNQPSGTPINDHNLPNVITYELQDELDIDFTNPANGTFTLASGLGATDNPAARGLYIKNASDQYVMTTDTEPQPDVNYYEIQAAANSTYKTLTTNVPGVYQVYVGNVNEDGGIRYVYSAITTIEAANEISIDNVKLPGLAYLDKANSNMEVRVNGANGTVTYKWYHIDDDDPAASDGEGTLIAGATTASYDPSMNNLNVTNGELRGWYYCEAINTKNNTVQHAFSNKVFIELQPVPIDEANITIERDTQNKDKFTVKISNMPYANAHYQMYANVIAQVPSATGSNYDKQIFDVANSHKVFTGETSFTISDLRQMYSGQNFDLDVYVVPVAQYNTTYQRYAERVENGVSVPAYTRAHKDGLTKE